MSLRSFSDFIFKNFISKEKCETFVKKKSKKKLSTNKLKFCRIVTFSSIVMLLRR